MARQMDLPILGLVENMAYFHCPDNGKDYKIFGESHLDEVAARHHLPVLGRLPIDPALPPPVTPAVWNPSPAHGWTRPWKR